MLRIFVHCKFADYIYGFMPLRFTIMGTLWGLGELLLAGLVAVRLYKEYDTPQNNF